MGNDETNARADADRTAWWGTCTECSATMVVHPHPERESDIPHPDSWGADGDGWNGWPTDCPVCGEPGFQWEGSDPAEAVLRG